MVQARRAVHDARHVHCCELRRRARLGRGRTLGRPRSEAWLPPRRLNDATDITARNSLALRGALGEADRLMVGTLVDRAFVDRNTLPEVPYEAERSDRQVLERLCAGLPPGRGPKGRKRRHLARALGRHVERAILDGDPEALGVLYHLLARAQGPRGHRGPNALALAAWALDGSLMTWPEDTRTVRISVGGGGDEGAAPRASASPWLFARIASALLDAGGDRSVETQDVLRRILEYWEPMAKIDRQYAGVRATASTICSDFAAPPIARTLYFGCEPGYLMYAHDGLDFTRLVSPDGPGTLVLFQPVRDGLDTLVAKSLKALFFEAILDDPDRAEGGVDLPLIG